MSGILPLVVECLLYDTRLAICARSTPGTRCVSAFLIGVLMLLLLLWLLLRRDWHAALVPLLGMMGAGVSLAVVLAINYKMTGLPLDQLLLYSWPIVNLHRIQSWGVLDEVLMVHWALTKSVIHKTALTWSAIPLIAQYLRLDLWAPIFLGAVPLLVAKASVRLKESGGAVSAPLRQPTFIVLATLAAMLCFVFLAFGIGREQSISFYRFSSFMYGPTLCLVLGVWAYCPSHERPTPATACLVAGLTFILFFSFVSIMNPREVAQLYKDNVIMISANALRFAKGRFSIKDAYQNQQGWPGRMPWGGIYPAMESVSRIVGPDVPIYSMHVHSYCMLPRCVVYGFPWTRLARDSYTVMYGRPEDARRVLQEEGMNYFLVSKELDLRSPLPLASLFSPDNIGKYLAVKWTDGTTYLLTWSDRSTTEIDTEFIARYREQISASPTVRTFPFQELRSAYEHFHRHGLRPFRLPWCVTCGMMGE